MIVQASRLHFAVIQQEGAWRIRSRIRENAEVPARILTNAAMNSVTSSLLGPT
jgi:hypothetical protein